MMRVSTSQIYGIASTGMRNTQSEINKTQEQMSSGKRVSTPADDPVAATSILQLNDELSRLQQYSKNIDSGTNSLNLEETTLQSVVNLIQRMQELAVNAGNTAVMTKADYQTIADEVETRTQELLNLQNTRNASGQYIFAGYQGSAQPFVDMGGGNYAYLGDEGQLAIKASATVKVPVTDSGKKVFLDIPSGNITLATSANPANTSNPAAFISAGEVVDQEALDSFYPDSLQVSFNADGTFNVRARDSGKLLLANQTYTPGGDIEVAGMKFQIFGSPTPAQGSSPGDSFFVESTNKQGLLTTLARFSQAMRDMQDTPASKAQLTEVVNRTLKNLGLATEKITSVQGEVGARMNTLDSTKDLNLDVELYSKKVLNDIESLDYAEASTRLSMQSLVLSATQQSFVKISQLNLFSYL